MRRIELQQRLSLATQRPFPRSRTLKGDETKSEELNKVNIFKHVLKKTRTRCVRVHCLLFGDVGLNKLLKHPRVVDVCAATGTQRPISLWATKDIHTYLIN